MKRHSYLALFRPLKDVQSRLILSCAVFFAILGGAPLPIIGVIFARVINAFPPTEAEITARVSQLIAAAIAYFCVTWAWAVCWGIVGARISRELRFQLVDRALGLDQTYYETERPDITSCLTTDAQTIQVGTAEKAGLFIQSVSYFVVAFIVGFTLNARLTGILFVAVIPSMGVVVYCGAGFMNEYSKKSAEHTSKAASIAEGAINAVQVVQAYDAFGLLLDEHEASLQKALKYGIKKAFIGAVILGSIYFIAFAANALAFWQGTKINSADGSAGTVFAIVLLILDASFVLGQVGPFIQSFSNAASAGHRIFSIIDHPSIPIDIYSESGHSADGIFEVGHNIILKDVCFSYPARPQETILKDINITIKTGTTVGIVGTSGSGKSTIAALLFRIYDPLSGAVHIGEHTAREYNLQSLRDQIALVDQNPSLFSGSIYDNVRDGLENARLSEIDARDQCIEALKIADAWSFIQTLPRGLDTWLGEPGGTKLSGGQKQRVCLARALVRDPPLLILDEATSALDTISEASILSSLGKTRSMGHRTTVVIAHRLASVRKADKIIVIGTGNLIEQGNHETLMSNENGIYSNLIYAQNQGKIQPDEPYPLSLGVLESSESLETTLDETVSSSENEKSIGPQLKLFSLLKRAFLLSQPKLFLSIAAFIGSIMTGGIIVGESIVFGNLVELLNSSSDGYGLNMSRVKLFCLIFFILALVALSGYVISGTCFGVMSENLIIRTRDVSLQTILRQDMEWFLEPGRSTSSLMSVVHMDSGHLSGLSGVIIGTILSALVSVIGGAVLAHIVAWKIAIVLFATSPIVVMAGYVRLRVLTKMEEKSQMAYTESAALAVEACNAIRTVAALRTQDKISKRFHVAVNKFQRQTLRETAVGNLLLAFALAITYFVYALAYWWGSKEVRSGEYSPLQFFVVLPAILFSAQTAGQLFSLAPDISRAQSAAARVFSLHDQKPSIDRTRITIYPEKSREKQLIDSSVSRPLNCEKGSIELQNISFNYRSRPNAIVFKDLSIGIKSGQTTALVGRSGAGKSSIISLLERFYDPTHGKLLIDGIDIKSIPVSQHRARISLVPQDPDLFTGTVAFNVGLGARSGELVLMEDIINACKAVGIHDFINGLSDGYNTQCGINGSQLSGGQKQRIAIARAYIRNPEILLLDEATSALDPHSEQQIQKSLMAMCSSRKCTTIIVAHRLTSVSHANRILVFDRGKVVEDGNHETLCRNGGIYEQMCRVQKMS